MKFNETPWPDDKDCPFELDINIDFSADFVKLHQWRDKYYGEYNNGLEPDDYETEKEFKYAMAHVPTQHNAYLSKGEQYIYCKVRFKWSYDTYYYRTNDASILAGDIVIVPTGKENETKEAYVIAVEKYYSSDAPYPISKTKMIISKTNE